MRKRIGVVGRFLTALAAGAFALQVAGCGTQEMKTQLARGMSTALNGMFNIVTTDLANEIFDVDD